MASSSVPSSSSLSSSSSLGMMTSIVGAWKERNMIFNFSVRLPARLGSGDVWQLSGMRWVPNGGAEIMKNESFVLYFLSSFFVN